MDDSVGPATLHDNLANCLFESATEAMCLIEIDSGKILKANRAAAELIGIESDTLATLDCQDVFNRHIFQDGVKRPLVIRSLYDDTISCDASYQVVSLEGQKCGLLKLSAVPSESRIDQSDSTHRESIFRSLSDRSPHGVLLLDQHGDVFYANQACARITGQSIDDCLGDGWTQTIHPADKPTVTNALKSLIFDDESFAGEIRFQVDSQELVWSYVCIETRICDRGEVAGFVGSMIDVTEQTEAKALIRQRENQLAQVTRNSTISELVSGIAHEVNQPLYSILNFAKATNIQLGKLTGDQIDEQQLAQIIHWNDQIMIAANSAGDIIQRLRRFASQPSSNPVPAEIDVAISQTLDLLAHKIKRAAVTLHLELNSLGAIVTLDQIHIQQIIVNLIVNAIEAIEQHQTDFREIIVQTSCCNNFVQITVADSGPGFPPESGDNFFEAF